jgi:xyloglucan-specific exo-beta-1,4-glucanase
MKMHRMLQLAAGLALCAQTFAQTSTPYQWDNVQIGGGGFVSGLIMSRTQANLFYARTDVGGAYRWDNNAARWIPLLDWVSEDETGLLGVESLALDPKDSAKVYIVAGLSYFSGGKSVVLRSSDYGQTFAVTDVTNQFRVHGNGMGRSNGERIQVDPGSSNVLFVGSRTNGLFKSTNSGASFSRVTSLPVTTTPNENGISFVLLDPSSVSGGVAQRILVGVSRFGSVGANLYRSNDGGNSFSAVGAAPSSLMPQRAVRASDGNVYITYANGAGPMGHWSQPEPADTGQIWKYNIASGSWTNVTPAGYTNAFGGISVDPNNAQRLVASTINTWMQQGDAWGDHFFITTNGGGSWTDVVNRGFSEDNGGVSWIAGNSIHWAGSIEFDPYNTKHVYVTSGNGVFRTQDIDASTTHWSFFVKGLEETVPLNIASIPGGPLVTVVGDYDGFRHTDVSQYAPIHTPRIGTTLGLSVAPANAWNVVRVGSSMYYSTNSASSWTQAPSTRGTQGQVALNANATVLLHSPENSNTTYRTTDWGANWSTVGGLGSTNLRPVADAVNPNKFYAYDNGTMRVSTNAGVSFAAGGTLASGGSNVIRTTPGVEGHIWVALKGGGLARSTNSGTSFSTLGNVSHCGAVGFGMTAPGASYPTIYIWGTVSGIRGIWRSTDTGASWVRVNDDAHEFGGPGNGEFVIGDMNTYGVVYMSSAGRGVIVGKPSGGGTPPGTATRVRSRSSSKCMDVNGVSQAAGAMVIQWDCGTGGNQQWTFEDAGGGYKRLKVSHSAQCLDLANQSTANNVGLVQNSCGTGQSQQWTQQDAGGGYYRLINRFSGKCADVPGSSTSNGTQLIQWTCGNGTNQQWQNF